MLLRTKLLLSLVLIALIPLGLFGFTSYQISTNSLLEVEKKDLENALDSVNRAVGDIQKGIASNTLDEAVWNEMHDQAAMDTPDPEWIKANLSLDNATAIPVTFGLTVVGLWNHDNKLTYKLGPGDVLGAQLGDSIKRAPTVKEAFPAILAVDQNIYIVAVAAIRNGEGNDPNGILLLGRQLGPDDLAQIKALTGYDVALYKDQAPIVTTQSVTLTPAAQALATAAAGQRTYDQSDANTALALTPITGSDGKVIATMVMWRSRAATTAAQSSIATSLAIWFSAGALLAVIVAVLLGRSIARPLSTMAGIADRLAEGDLSQRVQVISKDELGHLAKAFNQMATRLSERVVISETENARLQVLDEYRLNLISAITRAFQAPVKTIRTNGEALGVQQYGSLNEAQLRSVGAIRRAVTVQEALISDLQDFSRAQQKSLKITRERLSLGEIVDEASVSVIHQYQAKRIQFTKTIPPELPPLWADRVRMGQIVESLLGWAHDYTTSGGRVEIRAAYQPTAILITVSDTGTGLAPDDQAKIFDLFYHPAAQDQRNGHSTVDGNGLGLALTKSLIEYQGGSITLTTQPGQGNTFTVTMPIAK